MAFSYVSVGSVPNDGTGDDIRSAFLKVNASLAFLLAMIPPTQAIVYQSNPGDPGENRIFGDNPLTIQQNIVLGDADAVDAQTTIITKTDSSEWFIHITTTSAGFGDGAEYIDLSLLGESIKLVPNPTDNKWYKQS
jgi:hypothetical protein